MKKAISPLIGSILIIGFTVAIAAVVMFWSSGFIKTTTSTTEEKVAEQVTLLRDLEMKVRDANVNLTDSTVRIKIENKNEKRIEGFIVKLYGTDGTFTNDTVDVALDALEIKYITVSYNSSIGNITKIEVIPKVTINQKTMAATLQSDEFIAPLITGAAPSGEFVADANTVLLFHFDKDASDEGESKEYSYDSSMVAWYHFNNDSAYKENDTKVYDFSGKNNNGTFHNNASDGIGSDTGLTGVSGNGKFNKAFAFDGDGDYINRADPADGSLDFGAGNFSLEAWVKINQNKLAVIIEKKNNMGTINEKGYGMFIESGYYYYVISDGTSLYKIQTEPITLDVWKHLSAVRDGNSWLFYLDGVLKKTTNISNVSDISNTYNLQIGRDNVGRYFNGTIDEVAIYNRSLSAEEIKLHAGILARDYSTYGNNGTISAATWTSSGKFGPALSLDGTNSLVNISHSSSLNIIDAITIDAWVKGTFGTSSLHSIVSKFVNGVTAGTSYYLQVNNGNLTGYIVKDGSNTILFRGSILSNNVWHHVALTFDGSTKTANLYIDGVLDKTQTSPTVNSIQSTATNLLIGAAYESTGATSRYFNGTIDEVRISNIARYS